MVSSLSQLRLKWIHTIQASHTCTLNDTGQTARQRRDVKVGKWSLERGRYDDVMVFPCPPRQEYNESVTRQHLRLLFSSTVRLPVLLLVLLMLTSAGQARRDLILPSTRWLA